MNEIRCCEIKGMDMNELQAAIDRLKKVPTACTSSWDALEAFMGKGVWTVDEFRDLLVDVLMQAQSKWWSNHPTIREDLESLNDELLANMGFMRLPKDRDGEIIRPGDMVDLSGEVLKVNSVKAFIGTGSSYYHIIMGDHCEYSVNPDMLTHYHEPTIKDVLRDFLSAVEDAKRKGYDDAPDEEYAECAERLREVMDA